MPNPLSYTSVLYGLSVQHKKLLSATDILKISEEELPLLTGTSDLAEGSLQLWEKGISLVLVTLGSDGAFCRFRDQVFMIPGIRTRVADTNGAGDTFMGAVLSQLCHYERPLEKLEDHHLKSILSFANKAASITCSRNGAIPAMPTLEEVKEAYCG